MSRRSFLCLLKQSGGTDWKLCKLFLLPKRQFNKNELLFLLNSSMCYKMKYNTFSKALRMMQQLNRKPGFDLRRAYKCPSCGKWHLTSMELSEYLRK